MPRFSRPELTVLCFLMVIALMALGYRLAMSSSGAGNRHETSSDEMVFVPSPRTVTPSSPVGTSAKSVPVSTLLRVHVIGAVARPGVYTLTAGSRVEDAVQAAGGMKTTARLDSVNLAARLSDGEQVVVAESIAQSSSATAPTVSTGVAVLPSGSKKSVFSGTLSINTATEAQLDSLPGIGPSYAKRIVEYRTLHGGFRSLDELRQVPGIGEKRLEQIRSYLTL